jgi:C4-dicarboxylate transporter, DctM subunit
MELVIGVGMFAGLLLVLSLGVPIAFALLFVALTTLFLTGGIDGLSLVASTYWSSVSTFTLTSVPMFMFMGAIISVSGMGARLYSALATILDGVPGGLAVATTVACAVMAAVSGSSVATAAAIGGFAIAEMRRHGIPEGQACGAVAGGGTLGILLPPSIPLIIYSIVAEQSIGKLFMATIVPGLIMVAAFAVYQSALTIWRSSGAKKLAPRRLASLGARIAAVKDIGPFALLIAIILGSLYRGLATPQEAASLGIIASLVLASVVYRELSWRKFLEILITTAQNGVMILAVIASAIVFGYVTTTTQVASSLTNAVSQAHVSPLTLFISINLLLIFLGFFMETIAIIVVTMPILVPVVQAYHWDLIWFGVIVVINMEMALIHPPVGLNLFVVQSVAPDVALRRIVLGTLPYVFIMMGMLALVGVFPSLTSLLYMK